MLTLRFIHYFCSTIFVLCVKSVYLNLFSNVEGGVYLNLLSNIEESGVDNLHAEL